PRRTGPIGSRGPTLTTESSPEFPVETIRSLLFEQFAVIDDLLADLDTDSWFTPSTLPGWTVKDIVAHLIGTESLLAGEQTPHVDIDVHALGHVHNEIGAL